MIRRPVLLLLLAGAGLLVGIVVVVDPARGTLTLKHADETRSHLNAHPDVLRDVRIGDPVQAVVEGTTVRMLEPL